LDVRLAAKRQHALNALHALRERLVPDHRVNLNPTSADATLAKHLNRSAGIVELTRLVERQAPRAFIDRLPAPEHLFIERLGLKSAVRVPEPNVSREIPIDYVLLIVGGECGQVVVGQDRSRLEVRQ
jgi:hypothetical protein